MGIFRFDILCFGPLFFGMLGLGGTLHKFLDANALTTLAPELRSIFPHRISPLTQTPAEKAPYIKKHPHLRASSAGCISDSRMY